MKRNAMRRGRLISLTSLPHVLALLCSSNCDTLLTVAIQKCRQRYQCPPRMRHVAHMCVVCGRTWSLAWHFRRPQLREGMHAADRSLAASVPNAAVVASHRMVMQPSAAAFIS